MSIPLIPGIPNVRYRYNATTVPPQWEAPARPSLPAGLVELPPDPPPTTSIARDPSWLRSGEQLLDNVPVGMVEYRAEDYSTSRELGVVLRAVDSVVSAPGYVRLASGVYDVSNLLVVGGNTSDLRHYYNARHMVLGIVGSVDANGRLLTKIRTKPTMMSSTTNAVNLAQTATKSAPYGPTVLYMSNNLDRMPLFFSGLHFQGAIQTPLTTFPNAAAQGMNVNGSVPSPIPWNGIAIIRAQPGSVFQYSKFEGFSYAATSAPPFELGPVNSNYSNGMIRRRVEIDGRIAAEIDPARPRSSGGWMLNKEIQFQTIDCYDHHTRRSGNAYNTNTHRTDERVTWTRYINENIAEVNDGWAMQGTSSGGPTGFNGSNLEGLVGIGKYESVEFNTTIGVHMNLVIPASSPGSGEVYTLPGRPIIDVTDFKTKDTAVGGLMRIGTGTTVGWPLADALRADFAGAALTNFNVRRLDGTRKTAVKRSVYNANPSAYTPDTHFVLNDF